MERDSGTKPCWTFNVMLRNILFIMKAMERHWGLLGGGGGGKVSQSKKDNLSSND